MPPSVQLTLSCLHAKLNDRQLCRRIASAPARRQGSARNAPASPPCDCGRRCGSAGEYGSLTRPLSKAASHDTSSTCFSPHPAMSACRSIHHVRASAAPPPRSLASHNRDGIVPPSQPSSDVTTNALCLRGVARVLARHVTHPPGWTMYTHACTESG